MLRPGKLPRRFWTEDRSTGGFWENSVNGTWRTTGEAFPDVEERHYIEGEEVNLLVAAQEFWPQV